MKTKDLEQQEVSQPTDGNCKMTEQIISTKKSEGPICFTGEELLAIGNTIIPHLWEPFFPQVGLVGLSGSSDSGKSTFARQLCVAICKGDSVFLNFPLNIKYQSGIYISTEDSEYAVSALLQKQVNGIQPGALKGLRFLFNVDNPLETLRKYLKEGKADLVIIDVWLDLYGADPNNASKVRENLNKYSQLAIEYETCICIIHHNTKNSDNKSPNKNNLNGSQAIEAKLRTLLDLRVDEAENRYLSIVKGNYLPIEVKNTAFELFLDEDLNFGRSMITTDKSRIGGNRKSSRF